MDENRLPEQIIGWIPPRKQKRAKSRIIGEMKVRKAISERNLTKEFDKGTMEQQTRMAIRDKTTVQDILTRNYIYIYIYIYLL